MTPAFGDRPDHFDRRAIPPGVRESHWHAADGHAVRRIDWPDANDSPEGPRGSLLFLPGRGDFYEKYLETLDHWHRQGWRVTASDWRGQAGSGRLGSDATTGHVPDFALWVDDLAALWQQWIREAPGPHVLVAHSMGGHIALRALAGRRIDPAALVLSAPMLGFIRHGVPIGALHLFAKAMVALGDPRRPAWQGSEKPGALPEDRITLLTHDADRYADEVWWREHRPELAMGPASWGWLERALASMWGLERPGVLEAVMTPVCILATAVDRLVGIDAIDRAASRLPDCGLLRFGPEARHEILREADPVRNRALDAIDAFLAAKVPVAP
ncbi:MAG: alpha/beta hydrolase [Novosphingobium sp.]